MKIPVQTASAIYDILVEIGATEYMREAFIHSHSTDVNQAEWRFQGKLGFGGKFWNEWSYLEYKPKWRVSCYAEDETPKTLKIIKDTNEKLNALAETIR
jgi:hypothetical protein